MYIKPDSIILFLTDVLTGESWVCACEGAEVSGLTSACLGPVEPRAGWTLARGIVSRKKQIVPTVMTALAERKF